MKMLNIRWIKNRQWKFLKRRYKEILKFDVQIRISDPIFSSKVICKIYQNHMLFHSRILRILSSSNRFYFIIKNSTENLKKYNWSFAQLLITRFELYVEAFNRSFKRQSMKCKLIIRKKSWKLIINQKTFRFLINLLIYLDVAKDKVLMKILTRRIYSTNFECHPFPNFWSNKRSRTLLPLDFNNLRCLKREKKKKVIKILQQNQN